MSKYFIRVESINLGASVLDTQDLSTRRGGSLMMLEAIQALAEQFKERITPISVGASIGVFEVNDASTSVDTLVGEIETALASGNLYSVKTLAKDGRVKIPSQHGSFVVTCFAVNEPEQSFSAGVESVESHPKLSHFEGHSR